MDWWLIYNLHHFTICYPGLVCQWSKQLPLLPGIAGPSVLRKDYYTEIRVDMKIKFSRPKSGRRKRHDKKRRGSPPIYYRTITRELNNINTSPIVLILQTFTYRQSLHDGMDKTSGLSPGRQWGDCIKIRSRFPR